MKYSFPVGGLLYLWKCESKLAFLFKPALVQKLYFGLKGCFFDVFQLSSSISIIAIDCFDYLQGN